MRNVSFILSKFGDYDGQILLIGISGKIKAYFGGQYYLSFNHKYLFSTYDSDLSGLTVYDLSQDKVLFTSDTLSITYLLMNLAIADEQRMNKKYDL